MIYYDILIDISLSTYYLCSFQHNPFLEHISVILDYSERQKEHISIKRELIFKFSKLCNV